MTPEQHAKAMADSGHVADGDPDSTQQRILRAVAHVTGPLHAEVAALRARVAKLEGGKTAKMSKAAD